MWNRTANCIREIAREVLVSRGDWWWNGAVQRKVEAKKVAYMEMVAVLSKAKAQKSSKVHWGFKRKVRIKRGL